MLKKESFLEKGGRKTCDDCRLEVAWEDFAYHQAIFFRAVRIRPT